ncbi:hypothetical protein [Trujillonella humicola]|uniref:hypothetical protein n=1 Tax=Trujillonella humicola TaxID=3383699 RepID=UPI0039063A2B
MGRRSGTLTLLATAALAAGCTSEVAGAASPADGVAPVPSDEERQEIFCTDVPDLLADITADFEDVQTDPAAAVAALEDAVARMEEVQPPDDVADEWGRLVSAWRDLLDLVERVDPADPSSGRELTGELLELQTELVDAGTAVDQWGRANC